MKIALYFGSFNPIHKGHLAIAEAALREGSDEVWLVVSPLNPHKQDQELWPFELRLEMARIATNGMTGIRVSDCEAGLPRPSYTIQTLDYLQPLYPNDQFRVLIGGDNLAGFRRWKAYDRILSRYGLIVYPRSSGSEIPAGFEQQVQIIRAPLLDISASEIRRKLREGLSISDLVPEVVDTFIREKRNLLSDPLHF
ncbi:MAG: nicotinate-nucleotide adenylyltransferase [Marinilabiliales bacterium]|nr:nicotinate-nucleotide adenylyltransferase [Marinilabiliales bacterium]